MVRDITQLAEELAKGFVELRVALQTSLNSSVIGLYNSTISQLSIAILQDLNIPITADRMDNLNKNLTSGLKAAMLSGGNWKPFEGVSRVIEREKAILARTGGTGEKAKFAKWVETHFSRVRRANQDISTTISYDDPPIRFREAARLSPNLKRFARADALTQEIRDRFTKRVGVVFRVNKNINLKNIDSTVDGAVKKDYRNDIFGATLKVFRICVEEFLTQQGSKKSVARAIARSFTIEHGSDPSIFAVHTNNIMAIMFNAGGFRASKGRYIPQFNRRFSREYIMAFNAGQTAMAQRISAGSNSKGAIAYKQRRKESGKQDWIGMYPKGATNRQWIPRFVQYKNYIEICSNSTKKYLDDTLLTGREKAKQIITHIAVSNEISDTLFGFSRDKSGKVTFSGLRGKTRVNSTLIDDLIKKSVESVLQGLTMELRKIL